MAKQEIPIDYELVRDILGLVRLRCKEDNLRAVLSLIGALRVLHEGSGKVDLKRTGEEIKQAFVSVSIPKGRLN